MSSHYKFVVHVKTPSQEDDEDVGVAEFAALVADLGNKMRHMEVRVTEVERT